MTDKTNIEMSSATVDNAVEKVSGMLEQLAQQLGIAVDHFYPIFVKQQVISGYYDLTVAVFLFLVAVLGWVASYMSAKDGEEAAFGIGVIAFLFSVCAFVIGASALTHLINPEYHALMAISDFAGKLK